MSESKSHGCMPFNRAAFLAGGIATISAALPERSRAATSVPAGVTPERLLGRLMAGNKRFIDDDFPNVNRFAEKRELLKASQAPFAAILGCSDSRVIPNLVFVAGIGDLFVARVAGNVADDLVIASLEYLSLIHIYVGGDIGDVDIAFLVDPDSVCRAKVVRKLTDLAIGLVRIDEHLRPRGTDEEILFNFALCRHRAQAPHEPALGAAEKAHIVTGEREPVWRRNA